MAAPKGNKFWTLRSSHGRNPIFEKPEDLWDGATQYFKWVEEHPLYEEKGFAFQGKVTKETFAKMRAMTVTALCLYLDIEHKTFNNYRDRDKDFLQVVTRIEDVIKSQKFEGAAAELLNPNIIARDLGLSDRKDHSSSDGSMTPKPSIIVSNQDTADEIKKLIDEDH